MDDITIGELARRLDSMQSTLLNNLVGRPEYTADRQSIDYRIGEIKADLDSETLRREHGDKEIRDWVEAKFKSLSDSRIRWQTLLWTGAIPAAVAAGIGVLTLLMQGGR